MEKTYTVVVTGNRTLSYQISEEGAKIIWAAYEKLYGKSQTMERRQQRGCIAYTEEIRHYLRESALPEGFDWTKYIVKS